MHILSRQYDLLKLTNNDSLYCNRVRQSKNALMDVASNEISHVSKKRTTKLEKEDGNLNIEDGVWKRNDEIFPSVVLIFMLNKIQFVVCRNSKTTDFFVGFFC